MFLIPCFKYFYKDVKAFDDVMQLIKYHNSIITI